MVKNKIYLLLLLVVILAAVLRFYRIDQVPPSLYWDEAASTYNAFSVFHTGRDEYGISFPILFRSFNDYKASGNIYLTTIPILLFGLNELSARFTSAFFGTFTVFLIFFMIKELFLYTGSNIRFRKLQIKIKSEHIALLSAFMLAISPWHIQFSRTGFEANVALFFLVLGVLLFLFSLRKSVYYYFASAVIFAWNFYVYRSVFVVEPLIILSLLFIFRQEVIKKIRIKALLLGSVLFVIVLAPFIPAITSPGGMARAQQVNVFTNSQEQFDQIAKNRLKNNSISGKVLFNQKLAYPEILIQNYISHFNPQFLFISGDANGRHSPRGMGLLYLWEIPLFILGILGTFLLKNKVRSLMFAWILIAPIPAALSVPTPHALRSLNIIPIFVFFTAFGIYILFQLIKGYKKQFATSIVLSLIIIAFFARYLYLYYVITAKVTSSDWADGYKQLTQYVFSHETSYEKAVISGHYWQPYIYFLFYKQYSPALYQKYGSKKGFDKYVFGGTSWDKQQYSQELGTVDLQKFAHAKHILVALSPEEWNQQQNKPRKLVEIRDHNNDLVFIVGDYQ